MQIELTRWRLQDLDSEQVLHFPSGLLGFPHHKDYLLQAQQPDMPFRWLQATTVPTVAFVLTDPLAFVPHYQVPVQEQDLADLQVTTPVELVLCVIVTLPRDTSPALTVNLQGPLLINRVNNWAKQLVLVQGLYHTCHPLQLIPRADALVPSP